MLIFNVVFVFNFFIFYVSFFKIILVPNFIKLNNYSIYKIYDFLINKNILNVKYLLISIKKKSVLNRNKIILYFNFKINNFLNFYVFNFNNFEVFYYFFMKKNNISILYKFDIFSNILLLHNLLNIDNKIYIYINIYLLIITILFLFIFKYLINIELYFINKIEKLIFNFKKNNFTLNYFNKYENLETIFFFNKICKIIFDIKKYFQNKIISISIISHDLRIPLTRIRLIMDIIDFENKKKFTQLIKLVNNDIEECNLLISHFLSSIQKKKNILLDEVDLNLLISDIISKEIYRFKNIVNNLSCEKLNLKINILSIKRVIFNVIDNAINFGNTWIKISSGYDYIENKKYAWFKVEDDGCGISKQKIRDLFKLFVKNNYNIKGFGVGLFIVDKIVKENFGKIETGVSEKNGFLIKIYLLLDR